MAFKYSDDIPYGKILEDAHQSFIEHFKRLDDSKNAAELEKILREIKLTARSLGDNRDPVDQEMYNQYQELIETANKIQNQNRGKGTGLKNLNSSTLFSRVHGTKVSSSADDIFEEDLAAILAAAEKMNDPSSDVNMEIYLFGAKSANMRSLKNIKSLDNDKMTLNILNQMAEKSGHRYKAKKLSVATGKIDEKGYSQTLEISKNLPVNIARFMELMKDATFTLKNYKSYRKGVFVDPEDIGLHLGNTNLYKAITGALSEIGAGHRQQNSFFYRGAYTYLGNKHGLAEQVEIHFGHMRMIYELRGSGLLDESGHVTSAKYLIYNDPSSDAIYVKDTASLLREMISSNTSKLFGGIVLKSGKVKSN